MSGLSDRIAREPDYRPHCLNCSTMRRMTLEPCGRVMTCEIVRDDSMDVGYAAVGLPPPVRFGCGLRFDIETGLAPTEGVGETPHPEGVRG